MNSEKIKIAVVDDHSLFRKGLITMLQSLNYVEVIGEAENGKEIIKLLKKKNKPDIILMDIHMPEMGGIEATEFIKSKYPRIKIIALTMFDKEEYISKMAKNGANGYLFKASTFEQLEETINKVHQYGVYFDEKHQKILQESHLKKLNSSVVPGVDFSRKDLEILTFISKGFTNKEIALFVDLSTRTVEGYRSKLLFKTKSKNIAELINYAKDNNLIE